MCYLTVVFLFLGLKYVSYGQKFTVPPVILEAYEPSGFRASIPAVPGIELFAFHGRLNNPLSPIEPGDFSEDVTKSDGDVFTYYNPSIKLAKGDVVHFWIFLQHNKFGYRRDAQQWTVTELKPNVATCTSSRAKVENKMKVCTGSVVFEDSFGLNELDQTKWTLETYIPTAPDFEFVIYKGDKDVTFINSNKICIKPKLITNEEELNRNISLGDSCTKTHNSLNCNNRLFMIQNPIISGRITSKIAFAYGKFEIKARLPAGDWIIPQIYLEDENSRRILIAYSRGNVNLSGNDGKDIGGSLLFGGPVARHTEPERSSKLSSYRNSKPLSADVHTYTLVWGPDQMELFLDGTKYGTIATEAGFTIQNSAKFRLVLGVGAGGITDFPDDFKSGNNVKPWINRNRMQVKDFYRQRDTWYPTWGDNERQLQIEYVKVTAI